MVNIIENPVNMKEKAFKNKEICFRDENPKKFLGNAIFIIKGFKKKNRENYKKKNLPNNDYNYNNKIYNFRDRDIIKDINPEMKFGLNKYKNISKMNYNESKNKTYFHGVSTYYNKVKEAEKIEKNNKKEKINDNSDINSKIDSDNNSELDESENKSILNNSKSEFNNKKNNMHDYKDTKEMSKLALLKCNLLPNNNKKLLKAGEGIYISDIDKNIKGIYKNLMELPNPNLNQKSVIKEIY